MTIEFSFTKFYNSITETQVLISCLFKLSTKHYFTEQGPMPVILPDVKAINSIIKTTAKEEILSRYKHLNIKEIGHKAFGEIVTEADIQSELRLTNQLTSLVPNSTVVGEEGYSKDKGILRRFADNHPVWILDPLDGTRNFSEGNPQFCVIVAYCVKKVIYMGWIYDPIGDHMFHAVKGCGATCNGKELDKTVVLQLSEMTGSIGKKRSDYLSSHYLKTSGTMPKKIVRYRCLGLEYADLAMGKLHFAEYSRLKPWDHAAGILITEESGGYAGYANSPEPYEPGSISDERLIVTNNSEVWNDIRTFLLV